MVAHQEVVCALLCAMRLANRLLYFEFLLYRCDAQECCDDFLRICVERRMCVVISVMTKFRTCNKEEEAVGAVFGS